MDFILVNVSLDKAIFFSLWLCRIRLLVFLWIPSIEKTPTCFILFPLQRMLHIGMSDCFEMIMHSSSLHSVQVLCFHFRLWTAVRIFGYFAAFLPSQWLTGGGGGGGGGGSVRRARDSWWGGPGFDPFCGCPLPTDWVGVSIMWPGWDRSQGLPALSSVWQHVKLSDVSLGTRLRYSLVVDEDVKKPNKPTNSD